MLPPVLGGLEAGDSGSQRTRRGLVLAKGFTWVAAVGEGRLGLVDAVTRLAQVSCPHEVRSKDLLEVILSPEAQCKHGKSFLVTPLEMAAGGDAPMDFQQRDVGTKCMCTFLCRYLPLKVEAIVPADRSYLPLSSFLSEGSWQT